MEQKKQELETILDDLSAIGDHESLFNLALSLDGEAGRAAGCRSLAVQHRLNGDIERAICYEKMSEDHLSNL